VIKAFVRLICRVLNGNDADITRRTDVPLIVNCHCEGCSNSFFVLGGSDEFLPTYCCYCRMEFKSYYKERIIKE